VRTGRVMRRTANGRPVPFKNKAGTWEVFIQLPNPNGGPPIRRHLRGTTKTAVAQKIVALEDDHKAQATALGPDITVLAWLDHWIECQTDQVRPSTLAGYRTDRGYIAEHIGNRPLRSLTSDQIERLLAFSCSRAGPIPRVRCAAAVDCSSRSRHPHAR
jgi:hypothetical protein